ncbi:DnaJ-domain-containing protein [Dipodascopsis tothii]|uniref:DnaJ-domain-containing protein n=1 Tax=Dipodascopsis tothii TaxID=44089 RepID=UPI0034CE5B54
MADDIDAILAKEASQHTKDMEIRRILRSFKLDPYTILELLPGCTDKEIKNAYRRKSLLIHPDKTTNPDAPSAFNMLKRAAAELEDDKKRAYVDEAFSDARRVLIREKGWTVHNEELKSDKFLDEWREKTKIVLVENELRRRKQAKIQMEEEGRERQRLEQEIEDRKRKKDAERVWEEGRDSRINSWRDFRNGPKKKKAKTKVLG